MSLALSNTSLSGETAGRKSSNFANSKVDVDNKLFFCFPISNLPAIYHTVPLLLLTSRRLSEGLQQSRVWSVVAGFGDVRTRGIETISIGIFSARVTV